MIEDQVLTGSIAMTVASSTDPDPEAAAAALINELGTEAALYLLFVTAPYPRGPLASRLERAWGPRLIGCTSAGNIGAEGFVDAPVVAIALSGGGLQATSLIIEPISDLASAIEQVLPDLQHLRAPEPGRECFALMLVDGLAMAEEHVAAGLKPLLGDIPLIGGSAGDDLSFTETAVLAGGLFATDRASLTVVSTTAPFRPFRMQHYQPDDTLLVITAASPQQRLVHEINGMPAAQAFAEAIGVPVSALGPELFSSHPVLLRAIGQNWVRSISQVHPDGSLQFFAAIDTGAVLRLGRSGDAEQQLREGLKAISADMGTHITGVLAFDCILRRVDFTRSGLDATMSRAMSQHHTAGFSTYGEQFEDFHMNQTMVGLVFGG